MPSAQSDKFRLKSLLIGILNHTKIFEESNHAYN